MAPRVEASPYGLALVTGRSGVLRGRLRSAALARRRSERRLTTAIVPDPDGVLVGIVTLDDLQGSEP